MQWYVLYTKPKWELKVYENLQKKDIKAYCPTVTEVKQWSDRKKKITAPLFRSYIFVYLAEKERSEVFEVPGVVRYLYWLGKPAIVRDVEIQT
ncbi:UpxY family transcription antiterminator, partial [Autumnicola edwardsiae]